MQDMNPTPAKIIDGGFVGMIGNEKVSEMENEEFEIYDQSIREYRQMTAFEIEVRKKENETRKIAEMFFNHWVKEFAYFYDLNITGNNSTYYKHLMIYYEENKLVLCAEKGGEVIYKHISLFKPSDELYIRIFYRLFTDPKTFIKSYFGV